MRFVAISDTHGTHKQLKLPKGDVLVHAGDVTMRGRPEEVFDFLQWFQKQPYRHKVFIAGNHDFFFERASAQDIQSIIPPGITYLNDSGTTLEGIKLWGSPVTPWFHNWAFNRERGRDIREHWEKIPADTDLLITHGPPFGFLDMTRDSRHVGCQDLLRTVLTFQPKVHLFGHIHECSGKLKRSEVQFINASQLNELYELVNRPALFDIQIPNT